MRLPNNLREIKRRDILEIIIAEGMGVENDPVRLVNYFVDAKTFQIIFKLDPENQ